MNEILRLSLATACTALLAGVLEAVTPKGGGRRVVGLCGGLLLLLTLLKPFAGWTPASAWDTGSFHEKDSEILKSGQEMVKQIIEERTGAYIVNKSEQAGLAIRVNVVCTDDVLTPTPWAVTIRSERPEHARSVLSRMLEDELGIPPGRQSYELSGEAD